MTLTGVYMMSLVGGEVFRCHRGDEVMSSFDWRKKLHRQLNPTLNYITLGGGGLLEHEFMRNLVILIVETILQVN